MMTLPGRSGDNTGPLRLAILGIVVVSLFAALFSRLWYLQVMDADTFEVEAKNNQVRIVYEPAPRGRILDREGRILVDNRGARVVTLSRKAASDVPEVVPRLAALLNVPEKDVRDRIDDVRYSPFTPVPIADDVTEEIVVYIREHAADFPGVDAPVQAERAYPHGQIGAHVLGYVGQTTKAELDERRSKGYREGDEIGKQGVERSLEEHLRGQPGRKVLQVNADDEVFGPPLRDDPPVQGKDVRLTLDVDLQRVAEESLQQGLNSARRRNDRNTRKPFVAPAGSVVVLDPNDGSVLAMASNPTFNPAEFVNGIRPDVFAQLQDPALFCPLCNRTLQGQYSPGSTFKLVTSMAAMEEGLIDATTTIDDGGVYKVRNCRGEKCTFRNAGGIAWGRVDLARALTVSSDVFYYNLGASFWTQRSKYGDAMQDVARRLGFGERTGIDLPSEARGRVPDPATRKRLNEQNPRAFPTADWRTGDNVNLAIGQGEMAVTPLQLASAYATFANGGKLFKPRVLDKVIDQDRRVLAESTPEVLRRIEIPGPMRAPILNGLLGAVADGRGTARGAFAGFPLDRLTVAGKTGTVQVANKQETALFVAFAPAENPDYVVAVVMEEAGFGGSVAAPVARRILEKIAAGYDAPTPETFTVEGGID